MVGVKINVGDIWMVESRVADIFAVNSKTVTFKKRDLLGESYIEETVNRNTFRMISSPWDVFRDRFPAEDDYVIVPNSLFGTTCLRFTMIEIGHNIWVSERFKTTFSLTSRGFKAMLASSKETAIKLYVKSSETAMFEERMKLTK